MNQFELMNKELEEYWTARALAKELGREIIRNIKAGMTEKDIEDIAYEIFRREGVKQHWHMPIIGVGEGSTKLRSMYALTSSYLARYSRTLKENDIVLIDIAPVYNGFPSDYTFNYVLGRNSELEALAAYAQEVSCQIAEYVRTGMTVADVFNYARELIQKNSKYTLVLPPLISMGHRICRLPSLWQRFPEPGLSYLLFKSGGFITSSNHTQMSGLWVIEPYLIYKGRAAKFESLVFVEEGSVEKPAKKN